jgi:glutamine amidotransferase
MQLLADHHAEGEVDGLGLFPGEVRRIPHGPKIPHMGWNQVTPLQPGLPIFANIPPGAYFYFAHSYYVEPQDKQGVAAVTDYGSPYCSVIVTERVWGTQFHPEKSGSIGLQLLKNFVGWVQA